MVQTCSIYSLFFIIIIIDSILKSGDIALPTKVHLVKAMVFPVVMYGCGSWTIKKAERWRIDAFELWCWRRLLRVPWTAGRSNQSFLKEISPEYSFEGLMLKPILWPPDAKNWLIGKDSNAGKDWRREKKGTAVDETVGWHHRVNGHEFEQASGVGDRQGSLAYCSPWGRKESDWVTELNWYLIYKQNNTVLQCLFKKLREEKIRPHIYVVFVLALFLSLFFFGVIYLSRWIGITICYSFLSAWRTVVFFCVCKADLLVIESLVLIWKCFYFPIFFKILRII